MEAHFSDDLLLLANALRTPSFRFIVVAHNRRSVYLDVKNWLVERFSDNREILEFPLEGRDSTDIRNAIHQLNKGILLIPDLDFLLREENVAQCIYFNQRRDFFARLDIAFICFVQPSNFQKIANKLPDWWSLRSVELELMRETDTNPIEGQFIQESDSTALSSLSVEEKKGEIESLYRQIEQTDSGNKVVLQKLYYEIGALYLLQSEYDKSLEASQKSLELSQGIGNRQAEGITLNNISQIYYAKADYAKALDCLKVGLAIQEQIDDKRGKGTTLTSLAAIAHIQNDDDSALRYLEQSLSIAHQTKDKQTEGRILNNLSLIFYAKGDYDSTLKYLEQSLIIRLQTGDLRGEAVTLNNLGKIYSTKGDYDIALRYYEKSLIIKRQIGDK